MEKLTKIELKFDGHDLESIFLVNTDFNSRGFIVSSPLFEEGQELRLYGQKLKEETSYFNSVSVAGNENNILIPNEVLTDDDNSYFIRLKFELLGTNKKLNTETVILRVNSTFQGSQFESELSKLRYELSIKDKMINDFRLELAGIQNKELERESAEAQRKENEELRVNAETDRVTTFDNLTTDINSEFNDLKTKNTEIENAERTRVEQEQTRVDNENLRIQAEIERQKIQDIANLNTKKIERIEYYLKSKSENPNFKWNLLYGTDSIKLDYNHGDSGYEKVIITNNDDGSVSYENTESKVWNYFSITNINLKTALQWNYPEPLIVGNQLVFSIEMKSETPLKFGDIKVWTSNNDKYLNLNEIEETYGKWHRVWWTHEVLDPGDALNKITQPMIHVGTSIIGKFTVRKPMIHYGTTPQPWAPNPEDFLKE